MIQLENLSEYEWIEQGVKEVISIEHDNWKGNTVGHLLPKKFKRYLKILHPMYKDRFVHDKKVLWKDRSEDEVVLGERILWRELADELEIEFKPEINTYAFTNVFDKRWPRYLIGPSEGTLDRDYIDEVIGVLKKFKKEKYFFYYDLMKTTNFKERLYQGNLEDILKIMNTSVIGDSFDTGKFSPTYWWSVDREVCICTDYDSDFTVVGFSNDRVFDIFINNKYLECIELYHDTRIDYRAMM